MEQITGCNTSIPLRKASILYKPLTMKSKKAAQTAGYGKGAGLAFTIKKARDVNHDTPFSRKLKVFARALQTRAYRTRLAYHRRG